MKHRLVVGAGYGLKDWLAQRITALVMAAFAVIVFAAAMGGAMSSREAWQTFMSHGFIRFLSFLFIVSGLPMVLDLFSGTFTNLSGGTL